MKISSLVVISLLSFVLSACSSVPLVEPLVGPELSRDQWDQPSEVFQELTSLPLPKGKIVASVYSFRDLTGQYKPAPSSSFSTAVSQGAASMLVKSLRDSGWFAPLEREGLQDLLTERKIIRASLKNGNGKLEVPPLLGANVLLEGGIIGYETNMKTGGSGAKYFGIGMSEQYRVDQVSVNLRVVDVNSGRVINSVTASRQILSRAIQGGAFRFVKFKRLLEIEAGYTRNEPVQLCLDEAIQAAVMKIIVEGVEDNSWSLAQDADIHHKIFDKYGKRIEARKAIARRAAQKKANAQKLAAQRSAPAKIAMKNTRKQNRPTAKIVKSKQATTIQHASNTGTTNTRTKAKPVVAEKQAAKLTVNNHPLTTHKTLIREGDDTWVIQLMSSRSSMEVIEFARRNKLQRSMIEYIHYQVKGQDRFAILYGKFHDKNKAMKAIESLPPKLRIYEPWVKLLDSKKKFNAAVS